MAIAALVIALLAAAFTGYHVYLAFKEQKLRLRPQVYVDEIDTDISAAVITVRIAIQNAGLLPAKNVRISPVLVLGNVKRELSDEDRRSRAIILPSQRVWNTMQVKGEAKDNVLQGKELLLAEVKVDYESSRQKYFYKGLYEFSSGKKAWVLLEGDAN